MKKFKVEVIYSEWQKLYPNYKEKREKFHSVQEKKIKESQKNKIVSTEKEKGMEEKIREIERKIWEVIWNEYKKQNTITNGVCDELNYKNWCEQVMEKIYKHSFTLKSNISLINIIETSFDDMYRDEKFKNDGKCNTIKTNEKYETQKKYNGTWTQKYSLKYYQEQINNLKTENIGKSLNIFLLIFSLGSYNHNQRKQTKIGKKEKKLEKIKEKIAELSESTKPQSSPLSLTNQDETCNDFEHSLKSIVNIETRSNYSSDDNTVKNPNIV